MQTPPHDNSICCICGEPIACRTRGSDDSLSMDHVPPKQFYPKSSRTEQNVNLWVVPTHRRCNGEYKADEEYFYHSLYPLVQNANRQMGDTVLRDFRRRAQKPQTPVLIRSLLSTSRRETKGGILLPPGVVQLSVDEYRIQRVAIKIAQGLFYRDHGLFMPRQNCKDIRLCESEHDVPEMYTLSWQLGEASAVSPSIFSCKYAFIDGFYLWSLLFWEAFMFCMVFEDPKANATEKEAI